MTGSWEDRTAGYIKIVNAVYLAICVHHAGLRIGAHPRSTKMVGGVRVWQFFYLRQILFNIARSIPSEVFVK